MSNHITIEFKKCYNKLSSQIELFRLSRGNQLGVEGWGAVSDALERVTSLTSLNGCGQYAAIRAGGLAELKLEQEWELGVWAARFLERSGATLTALDVRLRGSGCQRLETCDNYAAKEAGRGWAGGGGLLPPFFIPLLLTAHFITRIRTKIPMISRD